MQPSPAASLGAERAQLEPVFAYVDQHADVFVERLRDLCRTPSVSAHGLGLEETFGMVQRMARAAGAETQRIDLEGGPPILYGRVAPASVHQQSARRGAAHGGWLHLGSRLHGSG